MTQTILKGLERAEGFYRVKEKEIPLWTIAWYNSENKAWIIPYQVYPKKDQDFEEINENIIHANPDEELEVPVAGVTDEEIQDQSLSCPSCNSAFFNIEVTNPNTWEIECCSCKLKWVRSPNDFSKLSVTGSKPLKTEEENKDPYLKTGFDCLRTQCPTCSSPSYTNGEQFHFIDTLDKEELLKQAKENAEKFFEWTSPGDIGLRADLRAFKLYSPVLNIMSRFAVKEYLRLCTGGGEKE